MRTYYLIPDISTYNKGYLMRAEFNNFIINLKCQSLVEGDRFYHQICQNCIGCSNIKSKLSTDNFLLMNQFSEACVFNNCKEKCTYHHLDTSLTLSDGFLQKTEHLYTKLVVYLTIPQDLSFTKQFGKFIGQNLQLCKFSGVNSQRHWRLNGEFYCRKVNQNGRDRWL